MPLNISSCRYGMPSHNSPAGERLSLVVISGGSCAISGAAETAKASSNQLAISTDLLDATWSYPYADNCYSGSVGPPRPLIPATGVLGKSEVLGVVAARMRSAKA